MKGKTELAVAFSLLMLSLSLIATSLWLSKDEANVEPTTETAPVETPAPETHPQQPKPVVKPEPMQEAPVETTPETAPVAPPTVGDLLTMLNGDLDQTSYTCCEAVNGGFLVEYPSIFAIGLPENYRQKPMHFIFYCIPEFAGYRTLSKYNSDYERNAIFAEDVIDLLMERNPDTIVAVMEYYTDNSHVKRLLQTLEKLDAMDWDTAVCCGWSAGGNRALMCAYELVTNYEPTDDLYVLLNDCNHTEQLGNVVADTLAGSGVKVLQFTSQENPVYAHKQTQLIRSGLPIFTVRADFEWQNGSTTHIQRKMLSIYENVFGYIFGDETALPEELYEVVYSFGYFDYDQNATVWTTRSDVYERMNETKGA